MKRMLKWFWMLSKRLYKKPSFVALMLLIPLCVALFAGAAQKSSGFVHIALAREQESDPVATAIMNDLLDEEGLIRFTRLSRQDALEAVQTGQADEAWIFPAHTAETLQGFAAGREKYIVQTVTREETVSVKLAREKLSAAVYPYLAKAYYVDYVRSEFSQLQQLSHRELEIYFEEVKVNEDLFVYGNPADTVGSQPVNYLTSPIRGLLAVVMLLCGMAATLYYLQDEAAGTFSWVRQNRKGLTALCCIVTATVNIAVVVLLALCCSGLAGNILRELAAALLYSLCCGAFCLLLKQIFTTIRAYAAIVPLTAVVMLGLCPVFFDFREWYVWQHFLPPTYYINASYDSRYFLYMLGYIPACLALSALLSCLRRKCIR